MPEAFVLTAHQAQQLRQLFAMQSDLKDVIHRVLTLNGAGVSNTPLGITINPPVAKRPAAAATPSGSSSTLISVALTPSGSNGTSTTQCAITYTVTSIDTLTTYATGVLPAHTRPTIGVLVIPANGLWDEINSKLYCIEMPEMICAAPGCP